MDQFLTYKKGNLGPVFNFTTYIHICCRVIVWAKFGLFKIIGAKFGFSFRLTVFVKNTINIGVSADFFKK